MTFRAPFTMQHQEAIFPWYNEDRLKCVYTADTALAHAHIQSVCPRQDISFCLEKHHSAMWELMAFFKF